MYHHYHFSINKCRIDDAPHIFSLRFNVFHADIQNHNKLKIYEARQNEFSVRLMWEKLIKNVFLQDVRDNFEFLWNLEKENLILKQNRGSNRCQMALYENCCTIAFNLSSVKSEGLLIAIFPWLIYPSQHPEWKIQYKKFFTKN